MASNSHLSRLELTMVLLTVCFGSLKKKIIVSSLSTLMLIWPSTSSVRYAIKCHRIKTNSGIHHTGLLTRIYLPTICMDRVCLVYRQVVGTWQRSTSRLYWWPAGWILGASIGFSGLCRDTWQECNDRYWTGKSQLASIKASTYIRIHFRQRDSLATFMK